MSLLLHEGRSVVEVARQAGHAPTMTLNTYAHVMDELDPDDRVPAESQIREAREAVRAPGTMSVGEALRPGIPS